MIKVELEPKNLLKTFAEDCVFCGKDGRYWHLVTNTPLCKPCSKTYSVQSIVDLRHTSRYFRLGGNNV